MMRMGVICCVLVLEVCVPRAAEPVHAFPAPSRSRVGESVALTGAVGRTSWHFLSLPVGSSGIRLLLGDVDSRPIAGWLRLRGGGSIYYVPLRLQPSQQRLIRLATIAPLAAAGSIAIHADGNVVPFRVVEGGPTADTASSFGLPGLRIASGYQIPIPARVWHFPALPVHAATTGSASPRAILLSVFNPTGRTVTATVKFVGASGSDSIHLPIDARSSAEVSLSSDAAPAAANAFTLTATDDVVAQRVVVDPTATHSQYGIPNFKNTNHP
ncbi:MAG: hypothetical protein M3Z66_15230 [Chloroflexota bacterium]|nr:hypothetical protein [Chloroflexota bacterium]